MIHNNKVYANADNKFVKTTMLYTNMDVLYHDAEFTKPVLTTEAIELFLNGVSVKASDSAVGGWAYARIAWCAEDGSRMGCNLGGIAKSFNTTAPTE